MQRTHAHDALSPEQEAVLVHQARHDPEAFGELYRHYFPRVYAFAAYRMSSRQEGEDLTAETFLRAIERLDQFHYRGAGSFAAWIFRIAHNLVHDRWRLRGRHGEAVPLDRLGATTLSAPPPETSVIAGETAAHLRQLVATLSPRRQDVVTLKFFAGLRNREVADVLGIGERAVASHLCRAVQDLYHKYSQDTD